MRNILQGSLETNYTQEPENGFLRLRSYFQGKQNKLKLGCWLKCIRVIESYTHVFFLMLKWHKKHSYWNWHWAQNLSSSILNLKHTARAHYISFGQILLSEKGEMLKGVLNSIDGFYELL